MSTEVLPALPTEVVTEARLRYVDLPYAAGRAALITLDNGLDHKKPNTFGVSGLASLDAALDEVSAKAEAGDIVAVCLTGKPFIFAVGADLSGMPHLRTMDQVLALGAL